MAAAKTRDIEQKYNKFGWVDSTRHTSLHTYIYILKSTIHPSIHTYIIHTHAQMQQLPATKLRNQEEDIQWIQINTHVCVCHLIPSNKDEIIRKMMLFNFPKLSFERGTWLSSLIYTFPLGNNMDGKDNYYVILDKKGLTKGIQKAKSNF